MTRDAADLTARLTRDPVLQQEWLRQDNLISAGLIAGCVALAQPFLGLAVLDLPGTIAVVAFALAIPLLGALLMVNQHEAFRHRSTGLTLVSIVKGAAQGLAVVGVTAAFWHILWVAGVAVLVGGMIGLTVHTVSFTRLEGIDGPPPSAGGSS